MIKMVLIKTHCHVSVAKKVKKDTWHTSVYVVLTGTVKLLNSAFCISKLQSWFLPNLYMFCFIYLYTTLQIKMEGNCSRLSWNIHYWKLLTFFFYFAQKLQILLNWVKTNFSCFNYFYIWNTYNAHLSLYFPKILRNFEGAS